MTLNILFFTITIKKAQQTTEEILHEKQIEKIMEENKVKAISMYRGF
ncbi:MAG: YrzI family small protein [Bacillus sp. (in: firmicutes)]